MGYYEENDGGAGLYKIVNDDSLVDDGGSVHDLSNGLKAELIVKDSVNVKQFGAYGDGEHDDTDVIQNVLDKYKNVYFSRGTYIASTLVIKNKSHITGEGENTILKSIDNNTNEYFVQTDANANCCILENFNIDGNYCNNISNKTTGLYLNREAVTIDYIHDCNHILNNIKIRHCSGSGLIVSKQVRESKFSNILCENNLQNGFYMLGTDSVIENCTASLNRKNGFIIASGNNKYKGIKAFANGAYGKYTDELPAGILISGTLNSITNCESQENCYDGVVVTGYMNTIDGNLIDSNGSQDSYFSANYKDAAGIRLYTDVNNTYRCCFNNITNNVITSHRVTGRQKYGVLIEDRTETYQNHPCFNKIDCIVTDDRTSITENDIHMINFKSDIDNFTNDITINGSHMEFDISKDIFTKDVQDIEDDSDNFSASEITQENKELSIKSSNHIYTSGTKAIRRRYKIIQANTGGEIHKSPVAIVVRFKAKTNNTNMGVCCLIGGSIYKENSITEVNDVLIAENFISKSKSSEYIDCCTILDMRKYNCRKFYNLNIEFQAQLDNEVDTSIALEAIVKDIEYYLQY